MIKISIIIPVVNLWKEYTENCINSLIKQVFSESVKVEIHIIDNNSTDCTQQEVKLLSDRLDVNWSLNYTRNEINQGVSPAWNYGCERAFINGTDYVFVINNDTLFHKNCIQNLINRLRKNDDVILVTPRETAIKENIDKETISTTDESSPIFASFMIDRRCWDEVGKFDEEFAPAYFEDDDYYYRIKLLNRKAIGVNDALFFHFGSKTTLNKDRRIVSDAMFEKNRNYYIRKWGGRVKEEKFITPFNN